MLQSNVFDYISVLDKAADASWMRHVALSNNNSNVTTPGYKRQDVAFESDSARRWAAAGMSPWMPRWPG